MTATQLSTAYYAGVPAFALTSPPRLPAFCVGASGYDGEAMELLTYEIDCFHTVILDHRYAIVKSDPPKSSVNVSPLATVNVAP